MIARQLLPMRVFDVFLSLSAGRGRALEAGFCSLFSRTALCFCRWSAEPALPVWSRAEQGARGRHGPLSDGRIARAWYLTVCRRVGEGWEDEIWERVQRD